jgi:PTS system ascorbate-specific IIA component
MSSSVLLITHNGIGQSIANTAAAIRGESAETVKCLSIPAHLKPEDLGYFADQVRDTIELMNNTDGLLILTDIYGATPNNLARYFSGKDSIQVVSGLNLPMLIRVLNYLHQPLSELVDIAIEGAHTGIKQD